MDHVVVYRELQQKHLAYLQKYCQVSYYPKLMDSNFDHFLKDLKTADGLFGAALQITPELLDQAENLRVVSNFSAGYDNLDLPLLSKKGIIATNSPDALTDTVADLMFSILLSTARRTNELDRFIRNGEWKEKIGKEHYGIDVHHRTIGIIGMGRIGRAIAKRAAMGFDMNVLYYKRTRDQEVERQFNAEYMGLNDLLQQSDFVCLTLPLTEETKNIISHQEFKKMKSTSILINGARGEIVDEQALIKALKEGEIRGAGLDVFEYEPLDMNNELIALENVVMTPHIGSATSATRTTMIELGIENLLVALKGDRPMNLLNEEVFTQG